MGKVVAVTNQKGGVGKTTVSIAMAEATAHIGKGRSLVIDLDPQINASYTLSGSTSKTHVPWRNKRTVVDYLEATRQDQPPSANAYVELAHTLSGANGTLSVSYVSGSADVLTFERQRLTGSNTTIAAVQSWFLTRIDALLAELRPHYALIVFDCPPGMSLLCEAAVTRSDIALIPVNPTALATMGIESYYNYLVHSVGLNDLQRRSGILKTMTSNTVEGSKWEAQIDNLRGRFHIFDNKWPDRTAFTAAMNRARGHEPFKRTYGDQVDLVVATGHELWKFLDTI